MNRFWTCTATGLTFFASMAMGCDDSTDSTDLTDATAAGDASTAAAEQAKDQFWDAFRAGDSGGVRVAHDQMIASFEAQPVDHELARLIGFGFIFFVAEDLVVDPAEEPDYFANAVRYTQLAVDLADDPRTRIYNTGFAGGTLYASGAINGDPAAAQQGRDVLDALTREIPAFGYLTRADAMRQAPRDTPDWDISLESLFLFFEQCTGETLDREQPDMTPVLDRPFADPDTTCGNWEHAEHGIQGALFNLADSMVKNGQPDAARSVYAFIPQTEGYDSWPFTNLVDERLSSDLAARAALYDDPDPSTHPRPGADCFGCHQQ